MILQISLVKHHVSDCKCAEYMKYQAYLAVKGMLKVMETML